MNIVITTEIFTHLLNETLFILCNILINIFYVFFFTFVATALKLFKARSE